MRKHTIEYDDYDDFGDRFDDAGDRFTKPRKRKPRFDDAAPARRGRLTEEAKAELDRRAEQSDQLPEGDRWSSWPAAEHGPQPWPDWVVTEAAATDSELGVLKTGKEADVHLVRRALPGTAGVLLAAKRYRSADHRLFHRDAGYLEGRRMRRSRETRAIANRTAFGRNLIAEQWTVAEFAALGRLWSLGAPVPYPVQRDGTELLLEYLGDADGAAPRLAQLRPEPDQLVDLWRQLRAAMLLLAGAGLTHGDLSPYNILVHNGQLMLIDLPQVVDLVANPNGADILARDARTVGAWFTARGLPAEFAEHGELVADLLTEAGMS